VGLYVRESRKAVHMEADEPRIELGANLKQLMNDAGYRRNRKKLASAIGVSEGAVSQYVNDQARPSLEKLVALAKIFNVTLDRLVLGTTKAELSLSRTPDIGPFEAYLDHSLANIQKRLAAQAALTGRLGQMISHDIAQHAERLASKAQGFAGMLTDDETLEIEAHSRETLIVSMNMTYDVIAVEDGGVPGRFLPVVARNIMAGRRYRYLLPKDVRDWTDTASALRRLLANLTGAPVNPDLLQVRQIAGVLYTPVGLLTINVDALEAASPILTERVRPYLGPKGELTYVIPASTDQLGDSLMGAETQIHARKVLEDVWQRASPL
jgi:transcriptional regulator with XRE-family HTH domain